MRNPKAVKRARNPRSFKISKNDKTVNASRDENEDIKLGDDHSISFSFNRITTPPNDDDANGNKMIGLGVVGNDATAS